MSQHHRDVVVIGASAGGIRAIGKLAQALPEDLQAAVLVVVHTSPRTTTEFHLAICGKGKLGCTLAKHGDRAERGRIYIAPPDRHLRLTGSDSRLALQVDRAPRENRSRPSVDALFRSAAAFGGPRVIGVLLTGYLDDGVDGLAAIERAGGRAIVQDPKDAEVPDLPEIALRNLPQATRLALHEMAPAILEMTKERVELPPTPKDLRTEAAISARAGELWPALEEIGDRTSMGCPTCGGPLWTVALGAADEHLRCHIGHAFSTGSLLESQDVEIERALHTAVRTIEEKARFLRRLAADRRGFDLHRYREEADRAEADAGILRHLLLGLPPK